MANATTNHDEIRTWVEDRGGHPARVIATGGGNDPGILRIDFPGFSGEDTLEEIPWDEFFEWFERDKLAMLLDEDKESRFNKLVARKSPAKKSPAKKSSSRRVVKSSRKTSASKKTSGKKASTKKASSKKASTKKASTKKASTKKTSTKKASAAKKSPRRLTASKTRRLSSSSKTTTSHATIKRWVEARGGFPAHVKKTGRSRKDPGVLRIDYPGYSGKDTLERMDWDSWFDAFEKNKLAFLYQDKKNSRFSKLVAR